MLASIELLLEYHRETSKEQQQDSLFAGQGDVADITLPPAEAATQAQRLAWEKELLGLYVSGHPLDRFKEQLSKRPMTLEELHKKMKTFSEIRWSEIARKAIEQRINDLEAIEKIASKSKLTKKDAEEISKKIKRAATIKFNEYSS